jgi:ABC-2 type transport system ATP-binding protein
LELAAIEGVTRVEVLARNRFRLHHAPDTELAERLASLAVMQDWGLNELTPEHKSLEQIFVEITSQEHIDDQAPGNVEAAA